MHKKIVKTNRVTVHYECLYCKAKHRELLKDVTNTIFLCSECNHLENYMEIVGVSIKEPKIKKNIKLQKECFKCKTFDKNQRGSYKCALSRSYPGINWSEERKQRAIKSKSGLRNILDKLRADLK